MSHAWTRGLGAIGLAAALTIGCGGSSVEGTYEAGMFRLEILSGGKAKMSLGGTDSLDCTYTRDGKKLTLSCPGSDPRTVDINDDGSLQVGLIGQMKKTK